MHRSAALASLLLFTPAACGPENGESGDGGECEANLLPGDLVLSEVMANPAGDDAGKEYIEIYNATGEILDLTGLTLLYSREDFTGQAAYVLPEVVIEPGQYLVLGGILPEFKPDYVDHGYGNAIELRNGGARLSLECGDVEVDALLYPAMEEQGVAYGLDGGITPDHLANDDPANFCPHTREFRPGSSIFGSPGEPNEACQVVVPGRCQEDGEMRDVIPPSAGDLVITELMANPDAVDDRDGEWFEITASPDLEGEVDLNDVVVGRTTNSGEDTDTVESPNCITLAAGDHALLARSADAAQNGGLPAVDATFSFSLVNTDGDLFLRSGETELDTVTWGSVSAGASRALDPNLVDPGANDDEGNWSDCDAPYGDGDPPDTGTPKADNAGCDLSGMCMDGDTPRPVVAPQAGEIEISEYMANPSTAVASDNSGEWFELRILGDFDLNGVQLGTADPMKGPGPVEETISDPRCLPVTSGAHLVFVRSDDPGANGGIQDVDFVTSIGLVNGDSGLFVGVGGTPLDTRTYSSVTEGAATQIDENGDECLATTEYGIDCDGDPNNDDCDLGTPGEANPICP